MFPEVSFVYLFRVMHMVPQGRETFPQLPVVPKCHVCEVPGKGHEILLPKFEASFKSAVPKSVKR